MTVLLVDGNNLVMRGVHAMATSGLEVDGVSTGPLLVVINALSRHIREEKPDRVVVCWDTGASVFRKALYPDYKGQRTETSEEFTNRKLGTFALVKEFLALANVHQAERPGYEADDLISWYVDRYNVTSDFAEPVVILSSDKDFLQLLDETTTQVRFANHGAPTDRWTYDRVCEEFGCIPSHLPLAMALAGDSVDNVPGVPRYGMKTAVKHLREAQWRLETARSLYPRINEHWDLVEVSLALVDLRTPRREMNLSMVPAFDPTKPDKILWESLLSFLTRFDMKSVKRRYYDGSIWTDTPGDDA